MFDVGQVCIKIAGRDAGRTCVVVQVLDAGFVLVDGQTRRRKCNVRHLEPTAQSIGIKSGASHADVKAALAKLNIQVVDTKPKKAAPRPKKVKKQKVVEEKAPKKAAKPAKEKAPKAAVVEEPVEAADEQQDASEDKE